MSTRPNPVPRRRGRRVLRVLLWVAAVLTLVALSIPAAVGVMLASYAGTRPQDRRDPATPGDYGRSYRTVFLETEDGVRVSSWLIRADSPAGCSVVLAHGLFRSRREVLERGAWLAGRGCTALAPDLRRHGKSGGGRTSLGHFEAFDILAGAQFLRREFPDDRLYLLGVSMGGAAAAGAGAADPENVEGVVLDSTFESVPEVVDRYAQLLFRLPPFPAGDLTLIGLGLAAGFQPRDLDIRKLSARLGAHGVPVLVIAGDADRRAPVVVQTAVFQANAHPDSRMVVIKQASHGRPCLVQPMRCQVAIADFFDLPADDAEVPEESQLLYDPDS